MNDHGVALTSYAIVKAMGISCHFAVSLWRRAACKRFILCMDHGSHCLEVCCYGIELGASIVGFNQSEESTSIGVDE